MIEAKKKEHSRSRKYLLTINNPTDHNLTHDIIIKKIKDSKIAVRYFAICDETGSSGTYHYHIFLYFRNAIEFDTLKSMFPTANIQSALGTALQCKSYLLKNHKDHNKDENGYYSYKDASGKVHEGQNHTDTFEEFGELPEDKQGKRSDLEYIYNLVKEGYTNAEIVEMRPDVAIKHLDKLNRLRHDYLADKYKSTRRLDLRVHYITGRTGAGKSRDILDEHGDSNVYRVTDYQHPFDSYNQEPVIVFEEYRSNLRLTDVLNYLDIYPISLPARYSPKVACYHTVYVVSNWTFEMQYSELQKDAEQKSSYDAWVRRFTGFVKEYTNEGIITYPTMQDYLHRFKKLPEGVKTPFDTDEDSALMPPDDDTTTGEQERMPFD